MAFITFKDVKKEYQVGDVTVTGLNHCSFTIDKGDLVVILGPSGAGKTTLLNLLGGMDSPTAGSILVDSQEIQNYTKRELISYRRKDIGFIFQFYNLVGNLTALENVELACEICPDSLHPEMILDKVGLIERINHFPSQLSGGEQQRVAIARALAKNPKLLLCDEPTGALDTSTGQRIIDILQKNCFDTGKTTVLITHNSVIAGIGNKVIHVKNGTVEQVVTDQNPKKSHEIVW